LGGCFGGHKYSKTLLDKSTRGVRAVGVASGVLGVIEREGYSGLEVKEKKKREASEGIVRSKRKRRPGLEGKGTFLPWQP